MSKGKARTAYTGELCIRNNTPAVFQRTTQIFYMDTTTPAPNAITTPDAGKGPDELLSSLVDRTIAANDYPVVKANQQIVTKFAGFGFTMNISNVSGNLMETNFTASLSNSSLIGFESTVKPRISNDSTVSLNISLPHGKNSFVIDGLIAEAGNSHILHRLSVAERHSLCGLSLRVEIDFDQELRAGGSGRMRVGFAAGRSDPDGQKQIPAAVVYF